jgi:hypothetical protein
LYAETASIKAEIGGIEAYTASLKGAEIVSSSQQVQNYFTFAKTGSANTFYGTQTISGDVTATGTITMDKTGGYGILVKDNGNNSAANGAYIGWTNNANNRYFIGQLDTSNDLNYHYYNGSTWATSIIKFTNAGGASFSDNVVMANGKGIDFSATSNSSGTMGSELLNDYEEGTWTPILADASTAGNTATGTFSGFYTKIGRLVTLQATCGTITTTGMTGANTLYIRGLPFAIAGSTQLSAGAANFYNVVMGANGSIAWINAAAGTTYIRILKQASGTTNADLIVSNVTSTTGEISFTIQYYA